MIQVIVKTFAIQIRQFLGVFEVFLLTVTGFGIPNNESSDLNQVMQVLWEVCSACDEFGNWTNKRTAHACQIRWKIWYLCEGLLYVHPCCCGHVSLFIYCSWHPKQPFFNWCLVKQPFFYVMIWNHPIQTTIKTWLFGLPGLSWNPVICRCSSFPHASGDLPFVEIREGLCWSSAAFFCGIFSIHVSKCFFGLFVACCFPTWNFFLKFRYQFTQPTVVDTYYLQGGKSATGTTEVDWILQGHSELQWDKLCLWSWNLRCR